MQNILEATPPARPECALVQDLPLDLMFCPLSMSVGISQVSSGLLGEMRCQLVYHCSRVFIRYWVVEASSNTSLSNSRVLTRRGIIYELRLQVDSIDPPTLGSESTASHHRLCPLDRYVSEDNKARGWVTCRSSIPCMLTAA